MNQKTVITHEVAYNWSMLSYKPFIYYDKKYNTWLCCWNGIYMTANSGFLLATVYFWKSRLTPEMKRSQYEYMMRLYQSGCFDSIKTEGWDSILYQNDDHANLFSYYVKTLSPHFKTIQISDKFEVIEWFKKFLEDNNERCDRG